MKILALALSVGLSALPAHAATIITGDNLDKLEALLPQLMQLEAPDSKALQQAEFQQHCDWQRHYTDFKAKETDTAYLTKAEQLISKQGFTPAQFLELSAKTSWPMLDATMPVLEISRQTLPLLPAEQRKAVEASLKQGQQYHQVIGSCLSSEDKTALEKYKERISQMASGLAGFEQSR
ncbi:hypothetical protein QE250_10320 [Chromatiaceae bacterium AAb-1]|nr:hypothetical protein [Chromatiaceae bacterium AAb-1]